MIQPTDNTGFDFQAKQGVTHQVQGDAENSSFALVLQEAKADKSILTPQNAEERSWLWNMIAREQPELLESDVSQGSYASLREARAVDIREKLIGAGVDFTTALIIANREASTTVRRPDGTRPGHGVSGYTRMPESVRSTLIDQNAQISEGIGYAYVDRYGYSHVVYDLATALNYSGNGHVYEYHGRFGGGYPLDLSNQRAILDLPQVRMYANAERKAREAEEAGASFELPGSPAGVIQSIPADEEPVVHTGEQAEAAAAPSTGFREEIRPLTEAYIRSFAHNARLSRFDYGWA